MRGLLRVCTVLGLLAALAWPALARAGRNSMIPPGQEQRIRALVDQALAAAKAADELPMELSDTVDLHIDRDRIGLVLHPADADSAGLDLPQVLIFHPDAVPDDAGVAIAAGVVLRCGPPSAPRDCEAHEAAPWQALAEDIVAARAPVAEQIWQVEEDNTPPSPSDESDHVRVGVARDRGVALFAVLGGLALVGFAGWSSTRPGRPRPTLVELGLLLVMLVALVGATTQLTPLLPLHEHNSFIGRSDCAIDPSCVDPPNGAWNMTTMHVYGPLLARVPYRAAGLAGLSLACSVVALILLWALGRTLCRALGRPELGPVAGLGAVAVVVTHPVAWRLAGSATFWPWAIMWTLGALLAGLWASILVASPGRREPLVGGLAWLVAAACLAMACGGNYVLLTLGAGLGLAPLAWTSAWTPAGPRGSSWRAAAVRAVVIGVPALAVFALAATDDFALGYTRAFVHDGLDESIHWADVRANFNPLLLDGRITAPVWLVPLLACLFWLGAGAWLGPEPVDHQGDNQGPGSLARRTRGLRVLAPVVYAWLVPSVFLGLAAGEIVGSGYPVGFINHHWELWFTALFAGLGLAWLAGAVEQRWPLGQLVASVHPRLRPDLNGLRWTVVVPVLAAFVALAANPRRTEAWRMATGTRVVERELVALEQAFAALPEHDLLVVAPRVLPPTTDAPSEWDPVEVIFPVGFYAEAMRARARSPAPVRELQHMGEPKPGERVLFYVGTSLRSFQPHEIAAGAVPDDLERPTLRELHHRFEFEAVYEFRVAAEQHEAISARLGADRVPEIELGFYWLHPRQP